MFVGQLIDTLKRYWGSALISTVALLYGVVARPEVAPVLLMALVVFCWFGQCPSLKVRALGGVSQPLKAPTKTVLRRFTFCALGTIFTACSLSDMSP